jgi:hypothetical protein
MLGVLRGSYGDGRYLMGGAPLYPHGGVRPFHQKSTCLTQSTSRPYVVQILSRYPPNLEGTNPSYSTVCYMCSSKVPTSLGQDLNEIFDVRPCPQKMPCIQG